MEQKPTVGRIVHYKPTKEDSPHNGADFLPAIIVRVWSDNMVNLKVINDGDDNFWVTSVAIGENEREWNWPPRV